MPSREVAEQARRSHEVRLLTEWLIRFWPSPSYNTSRHLRHEHNPFVLPGLNDNSWSKTVNGRVPFSASFCSQDWVF